MNKQFKNIKMTEVAFSGENVLKFRVTYFSKQKNTFITKFFPFILFLESMFCETKFLMRLGTVFYSSQCNLVTKRDL